MGTENDTTTEFMLCVNGEVIGPVSDHLATIEMPTVQAHEEVGSVIIDFPEAEITIKGVFSFWGHRCRSRRRFIKLMGGCFGIPRNVANDVAQAALQARIPSYQEMWSCVCRYFQEQLLNFKFSIASPVTLTTDAPDWVSE